MKRSPEATVTARRFGPEWYLLFAVLAIVGLPALEFATMTASRWDFQVGAVVNADPSPVVRFLRTATPVFVLPLFLLAAPSILRRLREVKIDRASFAVMGLLAVTPLLHSLALLQLEASFYSVLLMFYGLVFASVSLFDAAFRRKVFAASALLVLAVLVCALVIGASPAPRFWGAVHPNSAGGMALFVGFCALVQKGGLRWFLFAAAFAVAVTVNSRFSILGLAAMSAVYLLLQGGAREWLAMALAGITALVAELSFQTISVGLFRITDSARGIGSGLTGRLDRWAQFHEHADWLVGAGFRNRDAYLNIHSGFFNFLLEFGLIFGVGILLLLVAKIVLVAFERSHLARPDRGFASQQIAGVFAWLPISVFQPQLVSFGEPAGLLFFLIFFAFNPARKSRRERPVEQHPAALQPRARGGRP